MHSRGVGTTTNASRCKDASLLLPASLGPNGWAGHKTRAGGMPWYPTPAIIIIIIIAILLIIASLQYTAALFTGRQRDKLPPTCSPPRGFHEKQLAGYLSSTGLRSSMPPPDASFSNNNNNKQGSHASHPDGARSTLPAELI